MSCAAIRASAKSISARPVMADALLELRDVRAGYGEAVVLDGVSIALAANGSLAVLGRNGVGKTTLLLTMMGFVRLARGSVWFAGRDISRLPPHRRAQLGLGWVPQERDIFPSLTVEENLTVAARPGRWDISCGLRPVSAAERAPRQHGQPAVRRRAADGGDRTHADDQPVDPAAR